MKAIILAAGEGKRLKPLTNDKPKCLVKLFGKTLLEMQIEKLRDCEINDIAIVTGYHDEKIDYPNLKYFHNEKFESTNMIESLICARNFLTDETIILYGDIVFEKIVLQKLIESNHDISLIVDKNWKSLWKERFENPLNDAESLKVDESGFISDIGQKVKKIDEICAQYIGLMKFSKQSILNLLSFYDESKNKSKNGINPLNSTLPFEKSYMTDLLQELIKKGKKLSPVFINNGWLEIDTLDDLTLYNNLYTNKTIAKFFSVDDK